MEGIIEANRVKWHTATSHSFLTACKEGTVEAEQFNRWLVQDYFYVRGFVRILGVMLGSAPDKHLDVLVSGAAALDAELTWFKAKAVERGIDLQQQTMLDACQRYRAFMQDLHTAPYAVQAAGFWAMEAAYHESWANLGNLQNQYQEFADRWGNKQFGKYVEDLQRQADEALVQSPELEQRIKEVAVQVMELETDFWNMAYAV